jgi:tetrathionate reductase subunit B
MDKKTFLIDVDRCSGCGLCVIACKDEHVDNSYAPWTQAQPQTGQFWIRVHPMERGHAPRVRMNYLPIHCQHCENATCIKACPENAIKRRDDGLVWIDPKACTGCGLCQGACPYDVIYMNKETGIAQKCTGCAHLVDAGSLPRCVQACPHEAILFGNESYSARQGESSQQIESYHPEYLAKPRVHWSNLPKPWISGKVIDAANDEVVDAVEITSLDLFDDSSLTVLSDAFGDFWIKGLQEDRKYKLEIRKEGYQGYSTVVTTDREQDLGDICLHKEMIG